MNIFKEIGALFKLRAVGENIYKEATMDAVKPGWKTSEFWAKILTVDLPAGVGAMKGILPASVAAYVLLGSNVAYMLFRAWVKRAAVASNLKTALADIRSGDLSKIESVIDAVTADPPAPAA